MFNDYQLLLLQKEREQALARQWRNQRLLHEAKQATRSAVRHPEQVLKQVIIRTLSIALLVVLLALALNRIASAFAGIYGPT